MMTSTSKTKLVVGTLLIFTLGVLAGVFGDRLYHRHRIEQMFAKGDRPSLERLFMKRLSKNLDLTPAQTAAIGEVVGRSFSDFKELRSTIGPQSEKIFNNMFAEIEKKLTEEQKQELKNLRRRFHLFAGFWSRSRPAPQESVNSVTSRFLEKVDERITLTEEQRKQVHTIVYEHVARRRQILLETDRSGSSRPSAARPALEQLNKETEAKLAAILTPPQLAEYKQLYREHVRMLWNDAVSQAPARAQDHRE